jgi:hypothetical protein
MIDFIGITIATIGLSTWLITLANKWGIIGWLYNHVKWNLFKQMLECEFCTSWWTCVAVDIVIFLFTMKFYFLAVPFVATKFVQLIIHQDGKD